MKEIISSSLRDFRSHWKQLFLANFLYKSVALILFFPMLAVLFRLFLAVTGNHFLADQEILFFLLGPAGWCCLVVLGAIWLGIELLELAALMTILTRGEGSHFGVIDAMRFALSKFREIIFVMARLIAVTLVVIAPFLLFLVIIYYSTLTQYDINYYLKEMPTRFWVAVSLGTILATVLLIVLLRLYTSWFFVLPLVLFEKVNPSDGLRVSCERAVGRRGVIFRWLLIKIVASFVIQLLATAAFISLGQLLIPFIAGSLKTLTIVIGLGIFIWGVGSFVVNLFCTTLWATIHFNLYRQTRSDEMAPFKGLRLDQKEESLFENWLTVRRIWVASLAGFAVAIGIGILTLQRVQTEGQIAVIAHRGASKDAPENTMAAIQMAIDERADWVEIDVQETADGEVIVFHDSDLMRTSGVNLKIWDTTRDDLEKIDIGSWFDSAFKEERIPTLGDVLEICKGKIGVIIELKSYGHGKQLEQRVVELVESHQMENEIMLMSLNPEIIEKMKLLRPSWKAGRLFSLSAGKIMSTEADFLAVNANFVNRRMINAVHKRGQKFYAWTVNETNSISSMISKGVDGIITDDPELAIRVREQRTRMSVQERLLIDFARRLGLSPSVGQK